MMPTPLAEWRFIRGLKDPRGRNRKGIGRVKDPRGRSIGHVLKGIGTDCGMIVGICADRSMVRNSCGMLGSAIVGGCADRCLVRTGFGMAGSAIMTRVVNWKMTDRFLLQVRTGYGIVARGSVIGRCSVIQDVEMTSLLPT